MIPKLTVYRHADTTPRLGWNRYYAGTLKQVTIGAAFVAFGRCYSLQWRRP